ncbi:MAG: hypothetical protein Q8M26_08645 [Pseudolabrys sp.]|nr:hypothetical protein [Pseudolabrys sp.]
MLCIGFIIMHCVSTAAPPVTAGALFCQVAKPIIWHAGDTRMTKEQADRHNRIGKELCGWGKK